MELLLGVGHRKHGSVRHRERSPVADLAAGFRVEGSLIHDDDAAVALFELFDARPILDQRDDLARGSLRLVAEKFRGAEILLEFVPKPFRGRLARTGPRLTCLGALPLHGRGEGGSIHADTFGLQRVLGEIVRKPVSVVELEGDLARQRVAGRKPFHRLVEETQAPVQSLAESRLFQLQGLVDELLAALELRIGAAHLADKCRNKAMQQRILRPQEVRVAHRPAHDPAKHVTPAFVGGQHAVRD